MDETGLEGEDVLGRIPPEQTSAPTRGEHESDTDSTDSSSAEDEPVTVTFEKDEIVSLIQNHPPLMASTPLSDKSGIQSMLDATEYSQLPYGPIDHRPILRPRNKTDEQAAVDVDIDEVVELRVNARLQLILEKAELKSSKEAEEKMEAFLEEHKIHSHEHFNDELHGRAATFACVMRGGRPLLHYGNPKMRCNLYSITKSLTSLVIINDVLNGRLPKGMANIDYDLGELMEVFFCETAPPSPLSKFNGLTLPMLMNHVSGIDDIPLTAKTVIDLILKEKNTQNIVGRFLTTYSPTASFKYSPVLGYAMVGALYELLQGGGPYIKDTCQAIFLRDIWKPNTWHWREDDGEDVCRHSFAFSEVFTTGENMVALGLSLLRDHRPLLEYIVDDTKPYPHYIKHAQSTGAASYGHHPEGSESAKKIEYAYSEGWWILRRSAKERYLVAIGWLGQYLMIGVDNDVVAVRQHELGKIAADADVREEARKKKNVIIPNYHEFFPAHVISFLDHLGLE